VTDETVALSTYTRALGGTDPHPITVDDLVALIDRQVDAVWSQSDARGTPEGAEAFARAARELVTLAQSLAGQAGARAEMLRSTAEAATGAGEDALAALYDDVVGERDYGITTTEKRTSR